MAIPQQPSSRVPGVFQASVPPVAPDTATNYNHPSMMVDYPRGRAQILERMPIKMRQQYLQKQGYNVKVDGQHGPQTATAVKAYVKGIPAHYWNQVWEAHHPQPIAGTNVSATIPPPVAPPTPSTPSAAPPSTPPASVPPTPPTKTVKVPGIGKVSFIDPTAYATAAMDTKYGPAAAELARQMAQAQADQKGHQTDIQNWFANLITGQADGAKSNVAALGDILSGSDKATLGLVNALGGSANAASSNVAALGTAGRTMLERLGMNQANYDDTLKTALGQQGVETANQEYAKGQKARDQLAAQLADLQTQRGADYTSTLQQARDDRFKQQLAVHDARVSDAMLPGQLQGQGLDIQAKKLNLDYTQKKIDALTASSNGAIDWTKPDTRNNWHDAVNGAVSDRNGALVTDPATAWVQIQHLMQRNGIANNPTAMADAKQALQDALSRSHARGMFKNWHWGPKGLVKLNPKPKKK